MSCSPRRVERVPAARVAPVGAHPLQPRPCGQLVGGRRVVEGDHAAAGAGELAGVAHPTGRARTGRGSGRRPARPDRADARPGTSTSTSASVLDARHGRRPTRRRCARARPKGRLSSSSLASTTHGPGTRGQRPPGSRRSARWRPAAAARPRRRGRAGSRRRRPARRARGARRAAPAGEPTARRARSGAPVRTRGAAARTVRASVPGPAPASTTVKTSGSPSSSHQRVERPRDHGAEQRPHLGAREEVAAATGAAAAWRRSRRPGRTARASTTSVERDRAAPRDLRRAPAPRPASSPVLGPREVEHDPGAAEARRCARSRSDPPPARAVLAAMSRPRPVDPPVLEPRSSTAAASAMPAPPSSTASSHPVGRRPRTDSA